MGIEVDPKYNGTGSSPTATVIAIEELAKVDPALAILLAIHNSLICNFIMKLGTEEQKQRYLPMLVQNKV